MDRARAKLKKDGRAALNEAFQEFFGDGVEVTATPGKFKCEDYSGD